MRYIIAIGGNALTDRRSLGSVSREIARLARSGNEIVVTHGNGPQVGELAMAEKKSLAELTAQTEAEIGLEIDDELKRLGCRSVVVISRAVVDPKDPEFRRPSKPIGRFYTRAKAAELERKGNVLRKLIHGYRIVVPSPRPLRFLEIETIRDLLSLGYVVISGGGGGVAVSLRGGVTSYLNAVIDKDRASSLLAMELRADRLVILTNTEGAYLDFSRSKRLIRRADARTMERYAADGEFEAGSMLPKVEACISFAKGSGKIAVIGRLENAREVFALKECTVIYR
jgi:carbamate kinase